MDEGLKEVGDFIAASLENEVIGYTVAYHELTVDVRAEHIGRVLRWLKDDPASRYTVLVDITGVDHPGRAKRFDVVYHLLSLHQNQRLRVKIMADDETPVPSITAVHPSANWFEREVFDMFGVLFTDHPDLRRILTDYGFSGHPLRKDFPLTGHVEVRYDEEQKRVVYEPVELTQEFRDFDALSPWEGAKYVLPNEDGEKKEGEA